LPVVYRLACDPLRRLVHQPGGQLVMPPDALYQTLAASLALERIHWRMKFIVPVVFFFRVDKCFMNRAAFCPASSLPGDPLR